MSFLSFKNALQTNITAVNHKNNFSLTFRRFANAVCNQDKTQQGFSTSWHLSISRNRTRKCRNDSGSRLRPKIPRLFITRCRTEPISPFNLEFLQDFEFTREHINVFASEAARCEAIIFPVLKESYKAYADRYALWIKQSIGYDDVLNGTPDYFISTRSELGKTVVGSPLILLD